MLTAINVSGVLAYNIVQGSTNGMKLFYWTLHRLLPVCTPYPGPNSVLILDNVRFHKYAPFRLICSFAGVRLVFLPPYSPHLNVVELVFNVLKQHLRRYPYACYNDIRVIARLIFEYKIKPLRWHNVARKIGYQYHVNGL